MMARCDLDLLGSFKSDELGRQRALDRLGVMGTGKERAFERIVDLVTAIIKVPICAISLIDGDRQWFKARRGLSVDQTARDIAFCNHAIRSEAPFIVEDATKDARFANNPLVTQAPHIRSYLGIPLKLQDGYIVGALCVVDIEPRVFPAHQITILKAFAKVVLSELELRTVASTDALTGLMSREAWTSRLSMELERATRRPTDLCTMMIDIDHFSRINDLFGPGMGDIVMQEISRTIKRMTGRSDFVGRIGGEELAVCLVGRRREEGKALAESIRRSIAELRFPQHKGLRCTASIGVAALDNGKSARALLKRSDRALYLAKIQGRDRVHAAA